MQELLSSLLNCVRAAQGKNDADRRALQGVHIGIQTGLLQHLSAETVCEDDCEHLVTVLVDLGQDSRREAGILIQLALRAFDAGAVCVLRLVVQLLQQPPSNYDAGNYSADCCIPSTNDVKSSPLSKVAVQMTTLSLLPSPLMRMKWWSTLWTQNGSHNMAHRSWACCVMSECKR